MDDSGNTMRSTGSVMPSASSKWLFGRYRASFSARVSSRFLSLPCKSATRNGPAAVGSGRTVTRTPLTTTTATRPAPARSNIVVGARPRSSATRSARNALLATTRNETNATPPTLARSRATGMSWSA
jgi:hypothetical protein